MLDFLTELDALVTKYKAAGQPLDEMIADMLGTIEGLEAEIKEADAE
jgi:hypothetical protein